MDEENHFAYGGKVNKKELKELLTDACGLQEDAIEHFVDTAYLNHEGKLNIHAFIKTSKEPKIEPP